MGFFPIAGLACLLWAAVAVVPWPNRRLAVVGLVFQVASSALVISLMPTTTWVVMVGPGALIATARLVEVALERRALPAVRAVPQPQSSPIH